jgi:hypothetical protein
LILSDNDTHEEQVKREEIARQPDVDLQVPTLKVGEIDLDVANLRARVALHASVANIVDLDVGADVVIDKVKLALRGVEAQADLKVRLDKVYAIIERALNTIDSNPLLLEKLLKPRELLGAAGEAAGEAVGKVLPEAEKVVENAENAAGVDLGAVTRATKTGTSPDGKEQLVRTIMENSTQEKLKARTLAELESLTRIVGGSSA